MFPEDDKDATQRLQNNSPTHLAVGDVLKDRFEILEVLGEGGMGAVFKAVDKRRLETKAPDPFVAIKVLLPQYSQDGVLVAGLQREWAKTRRLAHANIIEVHDFDRDGNLVFMTMEYLVGKTLKQLIHEANAFGGFKLDHAWSIIQGIGEALAYAHKKGIVHGDFKPANVFITDVKEVKVLDFGTATRLNQTLHDHTYFNARTQGIYTPAYASLEIINGKSPDIRDDVYAFGLVVYELLTGHHPYGRKPASQVDSELRNGSVSVLSPIAGLNRKQWRLLKSAVEILEKDRPKELGKWLEDFNPTTKPAWLYPFVGSTFLLLLIAGLFLVPWTYHLFSTNPVDDTSTIQSITPLQEREVGPPVANPGNTVKGKIGEAVLLNGALSRTLDGSMIRYAWQITRKPIDSNSTLTESDTASPHFIPDKVGNYQVELTVLDGRNLRSQPAALSINVERLKQPPLHVTTRSYQATSNDGVLYLATSKPKYKIGDRLELRFRLAKSGYLRIYHVGVTGKETSLLPNKTQSSHVKQSRTYKIPPSVDQFEIKIRGPVGVDKIVAIFSEISIPKVKSLLNPDGTLVNEISHLAASAVIVQYKIIN